MKMRINKHVKEHLLTILTVSAVVLGLIVGSIVRATGLDGDSDKFKPRTVMYVNFLGDLFLRILKSLILPLIISSLIAAVGSLDISLSKRIGIRAIAYYMLTTGRFGLEIKDFARPGHFKFLPLSVTENSGKQWSVLASRFYVSLGSITLCDF